MSSLLRRIWNNQIHTSWENGGCRERWGRGERGGAVQSRCTESVMQDAQILELCAFSYQYLCLCWWTDTTHVKHSHYNLKKQNLNTMSKRQEAPDIWGKYFMRNTKTEAIIKKSNLEKTKQKHFDEKNCFHPCKIYKPD